jgi:hypothetical protein
MEAVPQGLNSSDWSDIQATYEAGRHAVVQQGDGTLSARNPGQQWNAKFDGQGFTVTPDQGGWTWGLELISYGARTFQATAAQAALRETSQCEGGQLSILRDENLTEWFVNDARGLEQGWTFKQRPERQETHQQLRLDFIVRGDLHPQVSKGGNTVSFLADNGSATLSYGGLKAWDADGKLLFVRFEEAGRSALRVTVDDRLAQYPITIDPIAQQAYLKASNSGFIDSFGSSVAISGDTVVVGAYNEDSSATGIDGNQSSNSAPAAGAVYVFTRSNNTWTQQAYLKASNTDVEDDFGSSVSISGDTLVVGAGTEDSNATGINGDQSNNDSSNSGAAYIFVRSGTTWNQQAYLKASNSGPNDRFGATVGISGDTVIVGSLRESSNATGVNGNQHDESMYESGAAYVFVRSGTTWTQQAYLKASNTGEGDFFGYPLGISGDTVVVSAYQEDSMATGINGDESDNSRQNSGAAYVFIRDGTTWSQQAYLKASNTDELYGDQFGFSIAISGDTVVVGANLEASNATGVNGDQNDESASGSGAAYVFTRSGSIWSQQAYLKASNTEQSDEFGSSVAISGNTIVVGAQYESSNSTGIDGDQNNNSATGAGASYVFGRSGTTWSQRAYLKASNAESYDHFGVAVAVCCDIVLVGAFDESSNATGVNGNQNNNDMAYSGAAYLYTIPLQDFSNAMLIAGLTEEDALFDSDPDNDGLTNGLEWVLGGDPTFSSLLVAPSLSIDTTIASLTFTRLDLSECSAALKVQWSSDLNTWTDVPVTSMSSGDVTITESGTSTDTVVVSVPRSNASSGKLFLRLVAIYTGGN